MKKTLLLAGVACVLSLNANASEIKSYVGLDVGVADVGLSSGLNSIAEDSYTTLSVNAGAKLNQNFGLEGFYQISDDEDTKLGVGETSFEAYGIDAIGYVPMGEKTNLLGSVGLGQYDVEISGLGGNASEDSLGYRFGLGADYALTDSLSARAMARYVLIDDMESVDDITEVSLGLRYTF